jgi:hypothetical protein
MFPDESVIPQNHALCNNANAAIRRELWEQHRFDESLSGLEDLAWGTWAIGHDHLLAYSAEAEVIHIHSETPRQVYRRYRREAIALAQIRPEESFNLFDFLQLYLSNVRRDLHQAVLDRKLFDVLWEVLWFRWMQFMGTYAGFRHAGPVTDEVIQAFYYPNDISRPVRNDREGREPIDYSQSGHQDLRAESHE